MMNKNRTKQNMSVANKESKTSTAAAAVVVTKKSSVRLAKNHRQK